MHQDRLERPCGISHTIPIIIIKGLDSFIT